MPKKNHKIISLLILILLVACSEPDTSYFPLKLGMEWQYNVLKTTMDGTEKQKYILINLYKEKIGDQTVTIRRSMDGTLLHYRDSAEGMLFLGKEFKSGLDSIEEIDERYVYRYPLVVGSEWEELTTTKLLKKTGPPQKTVFKIIADIGLKNRIASVDDTVKVPAGIFRQCIRIEKSGSDFVNAGNYVGLTVVRVKETSWYAPDIGLVKSIREESTDKQALDKGELIIELESFTS